MSNENGLSMAQEELLQVLIKEFGGVALAVVEVQRSGLYYADPRHPTYHNNMAYLEEKLGCVRNAMVLLCDLGVVRKNEIHRHADERAVSIARELKYS